MFFQGNFSRESRFASLALVVSDIFMNCPNMLFQTLLVQKSTWTLIALEIFPLFVNSWIEGFAQWAIIKDLAIF